MKKLTIILSVLLLSATSAFAQYVDTEAKTILDKTAQALQKAGSVKVDFSLIINNAQTGQKQQMDGNLWLKGNKFKLLVADIETYYNGNTQWVYMVDEEEVTVSVPSAEELQEVNPTAIIASYKQGFKLRKEDDKVIGGKQLYVVSLHPEDRNKPYHRIEIIVDKSTYDIVQINTFGKNGADTAVKVNKYEKGANISDTIFVFDEKANSGVEVIDLR